MLRREGSGLPRSDRRAERRLGSLLTTVTEAEAPPESLATLLTDDPPPGLAAAAARHGVTGYAWRALRDQPAFTGPERDQLASHYYGGVATHLRALAALSTLNEAFGAAGIEWVAVKGPVLAERIHGAIDLRSYGDLDVLVLPAQLEAALDRLTTAGGVILDRNWALLRRELPGEVHVRSREGLAIDLHWHLLTERGPRAAFRLDSDALLERRVTVQLDGLRVPTLSPEDTVLHLAAHMVLSGGDRLVWRLDLGRALRVLDLDERRLAAFAHTAGLQDVLDAALTLVEPTGPPERISAVRAHLGSSRLWRHSIRGAARVWPAANRRPGRPSTARLLLRATRDGLPASLHEATRRSADRVRRQDARTDDGRVDPHGPAGIAHASGGPTAQRAFLASVASHGVAAEQVAGGSR